MKIVPTTSLHNFTRAFLYGSVKVLSKDWPKKKILKQQHSRAPLISFSQP